MKYGIKLGQIYKSKNSNLRVKVIGKKDDKFKCAIIKSSLPERFKRGMHTLSVLSLRKKFELYESDTNQTT